MSDAPCLSHRSDVGGVQFNRGRLLNEVDRHDEAGTPPFAHQRSADSRERPAHDLDLHPFLEIRMGIKGKGACDQLADGFNLVIGDGGGVAIDSEDLDDTHGRKHG